MKASIIETSCFVLAGCHRGNTAVAVCSGRFNSKHKNMNFSEQIASQRSQLQKADTRPENNSKIKTEVTE